MARKKGEQEWTDVPFPGMESLGGFDEPPEPTKKRDFSGIAKYRRYTTLTVKCMDCANEVASKKRNSIEYAAFCRTFEDDPERWLCFFHAREHKHQDALAGRKVYG